MQDLHQCAGRFLPDVERVLARAAGAHVLGVAAERAALPHSLVHLVLQALQWLRLAVQTERDDLCRVVPATYENMRALKNAGYFAD